MLCAIVCTGRNCYYVKKNNNWKTLCLQLVKIEVLCEQEKCAMCVCVCTQDGRLGLGFFVALHYSY